ncbi:MAG: hypothetical protein ACRD44_06260 [Bryobacteraceae bacterium]
MAEFEREMQKEAFAWFDRWLKSRRPRGSNLKSGGNMRTLFLALNLSLAAAAGGVDKERHPQPGVPRLSLSLAAAAGGVGPAQAEKGAREETTTITGVVTQRGADFWIADSQSVELIAVLQGVGFAKESFARFLGMPVRVRGTLVTENDRKILRVRSLSDVELIAPPKK